MRRNTIETAAAVSTEEGDAICRAVLELVRRIRARHVLEPVVESLPPERRHRKPGRCPRSEVSV